MNIFERLKQKTLFTTCVFYVSELIMHKQSFFLVCFVLDVYCSIFFSQYASLLVWFLMYLLDNLGQSYFPTIENFLENKLQTVRDICLIRNECLYIYNEIFICLSTVLIAWFQTVKV